MKVQNEMATRISVDTISAVGSMSAFRNAITATTNAWKAQSIALKNSGDYTQAAKVKLDGLTQAMELQRAKIEELRSRQSGLDQSNEKQANQWLKLEKQINQASRQLASYEAQAQHARSALQYQSSGLASLQSSYRKAQEASNAYVKRLEAEGKNASASVEKYRGLRSSLENLQKQYEIQNQALKKLSDSGKGASETYRKQKIRLNEAGTAIAETKNQLRALESEQLRLQPTGIKRIDDAITKLHDHTAKLTPKFKTTFGEINLGAKQVALGMVGAFGRVAISGAKNASELQNTYRQTNNLLVTGGEKATEVTRNVAKMQSEGQRMSIKYGIGQKQIADSYQELVKRGYSSTSALGSMKTMLQASAATGENLNDVVHNSTAAIEAFGLKSDNAAKMAKNTKQAVNEMAYAADMTATDFGAMGTAMEYAGPQAKTLGYSVGETATAIGILSNKGLWRLAA